ncbi:transcription factor grauzone-like [Ochlerotatus camptorhynchus]|uniref:transcription factor grauzone-like n=1 Tax=Ochlerotatus camptorhynchus TaxID=644619 RepID=UPI0031E0C53A
MDPISYGCRLCLDPFAERFTVIENPELKNQMEKVFCFTIESKPGYRSGVCQSCSYAISEFYQYSEKVRQNQEILNGNAVKLEPTTELPESTEEAAEPREMVPEEETDPSSDADDESCDQPTPKKSRPKRKGRPQQAKTDGSDSEREKEHQLFSKHFRMICDLCGAKAASFKLLRTHFWQEHQRRDGYVVCCNKKLSKRYTILDHINFHANPDVFRCEVCGKKYKNKDTLNAHKAVHEGKDCFKVCDVCGREYKSKEGFQQHMNEQHMGIKVERFQCHICLRWLKGRKNHRNHMNVVHGNNERVFECDVCMQKYPSVAALKSHKKQIHIEAKHECEFCGKMFKRTLALKEHRATHTGEVLYSCEFCDMTTNGRAYLYKHVKQKHPVEWEQKQLNSAHAQESGAPHP